MSAKEHADKEAGFGRPHKHLLNAGDKGVKWPWTPRQKRRAQGTRKTRKDTRVKTRNLRS